MWLTVDQQGLPKNIHISSPLGAGLDSRAVQAIETWKFQPAQKDGQPVAVRIAVESGLPFVLNENEIDD